MLRFTEDLLVEKINKWKTGIEEKELTVNMGKTKVIMCKNRVVQVENTSMFPCGRRNKHRNICHTM